MHLTQVTKDIYQLSVNIENMLFEGLWEIPNGVTVNSYIVKGEKTALIDGVCGWDGVPEKFFDLLDQLNVRLEDVDYLVINHMEPDHSGWMEQLKAIKPDFKIVCTRAAQNLLEAFYGHTESIIIVKDNDTLDLGDGKELIFKTMPNVHWPDTMVTYEKQSKTLLSCDIFGSFGTYGGRLYDDELTEADMPLVVEETTRYYANIIGAFTKFAEKNMTKLDDLDVHIVAPGHGIVWRNAPDKIIKLYMDLVGHQNSGDPKQITLIYGSMYGMTERAVHMVQDYLSEYDINLHVHRVPETSWGTLLMSAWSSAGIILAMPTYENKMFPPMAAALEEFANKKVLNKHLFRFGSYGWSGGAQKQLDAILEEGQLEWMKVPSVEFKGAPTKDDLEAIKNGLDQLMATLGHEKKATINC